MKKSWIYYSATRASKNVINYFYKYNVSANINLAMNCFLWLYNSQSLCNQHILDDVI